MRVIAYLHHAHACQSPDLPGALACECSCLHVAHACECALLMLVSMLGHHTLSNSGMAQLMFGALLSYF